MTKSEAAKKRMKFRRRGENGQFLPGSKRQSWTRPRSTTGKFVTKKDYSEQEAQNRQYDEIVAEKVGMTHRREMRRMVQSNVNLMYGVAGFLFVILVFLWLFWR